MATLTANAGDQIVKNDISFTIYDLTTNAPVPYDFAAAMYSEDDPLDDPAKGEVLVYASTSRRFDGYETLLIDGVETLIDGVPAFLMATNEFGGYFECNAPDTPGVTLFFKAVFTKDGLDQQTVYWQLIVR